MGDLKMGLFGEATKKKLLLTAAVMAIFLAGSFVGILVHDGSATPINSVIPAVSGGYASSGLWETPYKDIFGVSVFTTEFEANWTYSLTNGSWISGYAPYWAYTKAQWAIISNLDLSTPHWKNTAANTYVAFGNGHYTINLYFTTLKESFYSTWTVEPNSWGAGMYSSGSGTVNY